MRRRSLLLLGALFSLASSVMLHGQLLPVDIATKRARAVRIEGEAPALDGRLDDPIWRKAVPISDFIQKDPVEGAVPSERTEIAFAYDDDALYIGARMYSVDPSAIQAVVSRRDNSGPSERVIIALDTYRDRRTAYSFSLTASGVRTDYYHPEDAEYSREYSFDPVWEGYAAIDSGGWSAEMRIPFSQLRFSDLEEQVWGLNIDRYIPSKNEDVYWIPISKDANNGWASRFGALEGIRGIRPSRRIELLPYAASGAQITSFRDPNDPFNNGHNLHARAGLDMKMGLGSNLTLDATINPDFGQVEADPAEVNLSAFETFFSERRPFFIEGSQLIEGSGPAYFYSRRIGAPPHGDAEGDFVDRPSNSTILGAAKLTGRFPSGLSLGTLMAVTQREYARTYDLDSRTFGETHVEPAEIYGVARLQQELGAASSTVGGMVTAVRRDLDSDDPLADLLPHQAVTGGLDWNIRLDDGDYVLDGYAGGSYVAGKQAAMLDLQRSSAHYFQRPDADYLGVDSARRSLTGYTAGLSFERANGEHWLWSVEGSVESPGFDLNDLGQLGSADDIDVGGRLTYRENVAGPLFRNYSTSASIGGGWNYGGANTYNYFTLSANIGFHNFWNTDLSVSVAEVGVSDNLTRGGPSMMTPRGIDMSAALFSDFAATVQWNLIGGYSLDELGGWSYSFTPGLVANLGTRLRIALYPRISRSVDMRQYVTTQSDGRRETYGNRYIFGAIDRTTLATQLRVSYAITPEFSVEAYAEPFAASGRYYNFGELAAPGTLDLRHYGTDGTAIGTLPNGDYIVFERTGYHTFGNPNFNAIFFRSNLVFRWEWRPGSTLYLVWQQDRAAFDDRGDHVRPNDIWKSITAEGDHFFTLKASYWLPID